MDWKALLFSFEGRVGRGTYWAFFVAMIVVLGAIASFGGMSMVAGVGDDPPTAHAGIVMILASLASIWPGLAMQSKRWHDVDKSAWWILIGLVPAVGGLIALVFNGFIAGTAGPNRFGQAPDPVGATLAAAKA